MECVLLDNQTTIASKDNAILCPEWGKDSVLEDMARKFYEQLDKIGMCSQGRMFFNTAMELLSEYTKEINALESIRARTPAEQTRLEITKARAYFVDDVASCAVAERFFFSMDTAKILQLPEEDMKQAPEWLFGTIFSEVGAAHACGLGRVIGSTVPEGPDWKLLGEMNSLLVAVYYVYDMYHEAVKAFTRKRDFTGVDICQVQILNARCSLAWSFLFACLREEVARKDPGSKGSTIGGDGNIYSCGSRKRVIDRMKGRV